VKSTVASALFFFVSSASLIHAATNGQQTPKTSEPARLGAANVKRLQPSEVPGLPAEFVEKLNARGCTIPQFDSGDSTFDTAEVPKNVIQGEFARKGQPDWAVLCSKGGSSTIVIFWGKPTACASQLARLDDPHFMQKGADKRMHFSRAIEPSDKPGAGSRPGSSRPKQMTHQGIFDEYVGKASSLFYCNEGKWSIFPGAG
jgi:hypothetical protein